MVACLDSNVVSVIDPADPPIRPERHVPNSIAFVRIVIARAMARRLAAMPVLSTSHTFCRFMTQ
jgi:hypothetical protein